MNVSLSLHLGSLWGSLSLTLGRFTEDEKEERTDADVLAETEIAPAEAGEIGFSRY